MSWAEASLESLCVTITSGGTPSRSRSEYWENGTIPWLKTGELNDSIVYDAEEKITKDGLENSSAKIFPVNTVLMAMYGDGKTITTLSILGNECATNQACAAMIADPEVCDYRFLFYALKLYRRKLLSLVVAGAQRNLSLGIIKRFSITVPDLPTQQRIASILSAYDDLIENNRRRIALLEQAARLLYREWFVCLRFPGHETAKIVDGLPEGWCYTTVKELSCHVSRGITPTYDEEATGIVINQKCIRENRVSLQLSRKQSKKPPAEKLVQKFDVLVNSTGAGTLGRVAQCFLDLPNLTVDSHVTILRPQPEVDSIWFGQTITNRESLIQTLGRGATNQTELSKDDLGRVEVVCPPKEMRNGYGRIVDPLLMQSQLLSENNSQLASARDLLLPRLMDGRIPV